MNARHLAFIAVVTLLLTFSHGGAPISAASVIYVDAEAAGANDGSSWEDAYADLQAALVAANSGEQVWVASGTYKPTAGTDRAVSFVLKNGVALYGGFAGTESAPQERAPRANKTILSGDIGVAHDASDNSYHVVTAETGGSESRIDQVLVKGGNADGAEETATWGGGLLAEASSLILIRVTFAANAARFGGGAYFGGGSPFVYDVTFTHNTATVSGAGLYNGSGSPTLAGVTFSFNRTSGANSAGGGMLNDAGSPHLANVTFWKNDAGLGAAFANNAGNPGITAATIARNNSTIGGAVENVTGAPVVGGSILWGNTGGQVADEAGGDGPVFEGTNLVEGGCGGDGVVCHGTTIDADPLLNPLAGNGGPTRTSALSPASPAIDAGDDQSCVAVDQRGVRRPKDGPDADATRTCDLGSYEYAESCAGRPATIVGSPRADEIVGTLGDDVIAARGGPDVISGRGGDDVVCGGAGEDDVSGGDGDDRLLGGVSNDSLRAGAGNDVIQGGPGNDIIRGLDGNDELSGSGGDDELHGEAGDDSLDGGPGLDTCDGGPGTDAVITGSGCETIKGVP